MKNKFLKPPIFFLIAIILIAIGFYFKNDILNYGKELSLIDKSKIDSFITEVKKEISLPEPLKIKLTNKGVALTQGGILSETNANRASNGLAPLALNNTLSQMAVEKAKDMFLKQYFEHVSPSGIGPAELAKQFGYEYIAVGENLILGNFSGDKEAVSDWMNSPGHRANILNEKYTEIGIAVLQGTYEGQSVWIGVQEFGRPLSLCPEPSLSLKSQIDNYQNQVKSLSILIDQKLSELNKIDKRSAEYANAINDYNQTVESYNSMSLTLKSLINAYNIKVNEFNACIKQ